MADEKMEEKIDERRAIIDPTGEMTFYIAPPTAEGIRGADWQYSKVYTKSLQEGITTSAEMMDILMRRGLIGPEFDQRRQELSNELALKVIGLQSTTDPDEKEQLAIEVSQLREELFNWNQRLNGPMSNTCEQMADDARLEYLTSTMVEKENTEKIWGSHDGFLREKSQGLAMRARYEVMLYLQGLESDFLDKTPEATAIREVESERLNVFENESKAEEAVEVVAEVVEKKTTRKRKPSKKK